MDKKTRNINQSIRDKEYKGPKFLYKYRPFDEYTFDMLENDYLYLSPAVKLDDITECNTTIDYKLFYDLESNSLKRECVKQIIEMLKPYTSEENYKQIQKVMTSIMKENGTIKPNFMLNYSLKLQEILPKEFNTSQFVNYIIAIPEKLDSPEIKAQIEELIVSMYKAKENIGVCSLSANKDDEKMWELYANNHTGYCIEFDLTDYENSDLVFLVVYVAKEQRETNIIKQIVETFIGDLVYEMSNENMESDSSQCLKLFLTKYEEWSYQNEWRILGDASTKIKAPKIKTIYIGRNVLKDDLEKMKIFTSLHDISLVEQSEEVMK